MLYESQACNPTVLAAAVRNISAQNRASSHDFIFVSKLRDIFQKIKNQGLQPLVTYGQHAYFFSLWLPNIACTICIIRK